MYTIEETRTFSVTLGTYKVESMRVVSEWDGFIRISNSTSGLVLFDSRQARGETQGRITYKALGETQGPEGRYTIVWASEDLVRHVEKLRRAQEEDERITRG